MVKFKVLVLTIVFSLFSLGSFSVVAEGHNSGMKAEGYSYHDKMSKKHHKRSHKKMNNNECINMGQGESHAERQKDCRKKRYEHKMKMKETWKEKHKRKNSW